MIERGFEILLIPLFCQLTYLYELKQDTHKPRYYVNKLFHDKVIAAY